MNINYHYQLQDGLFLQTRTALPRREEKVLPSAGIYYVAPIGRGWQIMACRYADLSQEMDHTTFWYLHVCRSLAGDWAIKVARPWNRLRKYLEEHPYGFPRGRVVCLNGVYHVYHGCDLPKSSRINRETIEIIFGIQGNAKWTEDDHEHCLFADKVALQKILSLEDDWPAV